MSKRKNPPTEPFRRTQVVSPVPSGRRFGQAKLEKKTFDIIRQRHRDWRRNPRHHGLCPHAREAVQIARKRLQSSPVIRRITYAAFTAVEVDPKERSH